MNNKNINMEVIIISGPSGSGKTTLSKLIRNKLNNGFILSTDNYYNTGVLSKIFSRIIESYFDRKISFNYRLYKKDLFFILDNGNSNHTYSYDFKKKSIKKLLKKTTNIKYLILEGIFVKELLKDFRKQNCFFMELKIDKESCMKRVIYRDLIERGKKEDLAKKDFLLSWQYYYSINNKYYLSKNISQINYTTNMKLDLLVQQILNFTT